MAVREGDRFGKLVAMNFKRGSKFTPRMWACICDCGNTSIVRSTNLHSGNTRSCGCDSSRVTTEKNRFRTHGMSRTRTYRIWRNMHTRCYYKNSRTYYGNRGIIVCERWFKFDNFLKDMGKCPENRSIDRINNDGNYEPGNCRWATATQQANNKRKPRRSSIKMTTEQTTIAS